MTGTAKELGAGRRVGSGFCVLLGALGSGFWVLLLGALGSGFWGTEKTRYKKDRIGIALVTTWSGENKKKGTS